MEFGPQHPTAHGVSRNEQTSGEPHIGSLECGTKPLTPSWLLCPAFGPRHGGGSDSVPDHGNCLGGFGSQCKIFMGFREKTKTRIN